MIYQSYLHKIFIVCIFLISLFASCQKGNQDADLLESALTEAGDNRTELEKVLFRFNENEKDSLKYKAACFLIENMPYYSHFEGEQLDSYLTYFHVLAENKLSELKPSELSQTIIDTYGNYSINRLKLKPDIQTIDSAYLCNNIEWAFKVWEEQPWGKSISFNDFCEYILPYKIGDEKPEYWREEYFNKYNELLDPLRISGAKGGDDPINAAFMLMEHIAKKEDVYFTTVSPADLPHVGAKIAQLKTGSCKELTDFVIYACRALGIPCHIDFMPIRGNDNIGHFWISYKSKENELYWQEYPNGIGLLRTHDFLNSSKVKVYRYTFSLNRKMKDEMFSLASSVPHFFENPMFIDVTYPYSKNYIEKISIPISNLYKNKRSKIVYLCTSQHQLWIPIDWTPFNNKNLIFNNIQKGDVMRLATWENNELIFQSDPFRIDSHSNEIKFYSAKDSLQDVTLFSKFDVSSDDLFRERMIGGVFEGSNYADFIDKDTLFVINYVPVRQNIRVRSKSDKKYRYVRYYGTVDGFCNVSEIAFYTYPNDTIPLHGKIIGTPGSFDPYDSHEYTNAFDGKSWTSVNYRDPSGGWTGLDLDEPKIISHIIYTPRNRDNYIRPNDTFELFYCDGDWKSLGIVISASDSLVYRNVPKDALLFLKNHSRGKQERIFTIENGKQIFW
jgi:hypothetical protein